MERGHPARCGVGVSPPVAGASLRCALGRLCPRPLEGAGRSHDSGQDARAPRHCAKELNECFALTNCASRASSRPLPYCSLQVAWLGLTSRSLLLRMSAVIHPLRFRLPAARPTLPGERRNTWWKGGIFRESGGHYFTPSHSTI